MSKIYKSNYVSIGIPKPIVNVFKSEVRPKEETEPIMDEKCNSSDPEEDANSIIEDAKQMYLKIIEEANSEAHKIVETAESQAKNLMSASREDGYKEGFETGYLEGKNKAQSIIDEASEIRCFLEVRKEDLFKESEEQILKLVLNIAKKVIGEELTQNKEALLSLVNQALQKCAFKKKLVLRISPENSDFIIENKDRICMMVEGISDIDIVSDLSLSKGSCIIETPSGEINSSMDVQIKEIEKIFAYLLRNE
ncbi:MAG: FliH/SctL family protein [Clostridiaceae bacterium]|nr:FliH/SctL family protein [Clostridiaceae bacterium]